MRQLKRTVTVRTADGNDHSETYVIPQYENLPEIESAFPDYELLRIVNRAIDDRERAIRRARLVFDLRNPQA